MSELVHRVARFFAFILVFFQPRRAPPSPPPPPEPSPESVPPPQKAALTSNRRSAKQVMRFKRTILDQLDDNTKIMGRMKACFPMEYGLYSQIGAVVLPHDEAFLEESALIREPLSSWFNQVRPSFGAVVTGDPHSETKGRGHPIHPRLMHFLKMKSPRDIKKRLFERGRDAIQPIAPTSDLYIFTSYFDERDWARLFPKKTRDDWNLCRFFEKAFALELPLEITQDGRARPLKIFRERYLARIGVHTRYWDYPYTRDAMRIINSKLSPVEYILREIGFTLRCYEEATYSIIQVRATKNGVCTLVNVNVEETPDFFDDREDVIIDGIKKRIFHIVRAHERIGSRGVRLHFRGLRQFNWNGYQIEISVPGREHFDIKEVNIATDETALPRDKSLEMPELGAWLVANQKNRFAAMVGKCNPPLPLDDFRP